MCVDLNLGYFRFERFSYATERNVYKFRCFVGDYSPYVFFLFETPNITTHLLQPQDSLRTSRQLETSDC